MSTYHSGGKGKDLTKVVEKDNKVWSKRSNVGAVGGTKPEVVIQMCSNYLFMAVKMSTYQRFVNLRIGRGKNKEKKP